jgi:hypothetical protein
MQIAPPFNNHIDSSTHTFNNTFITNNMDFCTLGMFIIGRLHSPWDQPISNHYGRMWIASIIVLSESNSKEHSTITSIEIINQVDPDPTSLTSQQMTSTHHPQHQIKLHKSTSWAVQARFPLSVPVSSRHHRNQIPSAGSSTPAQISQPS